MLYENHYFLAYDLPDAYAMYFADFDFPVQGQRFFSLSLSTFLKKPTFLLTSFPENTPSARQSDQQVFLIFPSFNSFLCYNLLTSSCRSQIRIKGVFLCTSTLIA